MQALSERNKANRSKLEMPHASGRHTSAQIRHKIVSSYALMNVVAISETSKHFALSLALNMYLIFK